jgi:hypothetical protein
VSLFRAGALALVVLAVVSTSASSSKGTALERHQLIASAGGVTARLSWRGSRWGPVSGLRIEVRRFGRVAMARSVPSAWGECAQDCVQTVNWSSQPLLVRDLDGDGEPEVLLNLYGEGAHCCSISQIYRYIPAGAAYSGRRTTWGADYRVRDYDRDGVLDFSSADTRFCFGCSYPMLARPVRIWHYRRGLFVDVTRAFPGVVSHFARLERHGVTQIFGRGPAYKNFTRHELSGYARLSLGVYVADMCLLDRCLRGWRFAGQLADRGGLGRGGSTYLQHLHRYLLHLGYWH